MRKWILSKSLVVEPENLNLLIPKSAFGYNSELDPTSCYTSIFFALQVDIYKKSFLQNYILISTSPIQATCPADHNHLDFTDPNNMWPA
jgi:hypothetical protein